MRVNPSSIIVARAVRYCAQDRRDAKLMLLYTQSRGKLHIVKRQYILAGLAGFQRTLERD